MPIKFHRNARPLPTDPAERKARVRWCMEHRLWHYPVPVRRPPEGREDEIFGPADARGYSIMVRDRPDWVDAVAMMGGFEECVSLEFHYVNPATESIEADDHRNTAFRVWIEAGGWLDESKNPNSFTVPPEGWNDYNKWTPCHDYLLDCGAPDAETAILELAAHVEFYYGDGCEHLDIMPKRCESYRVEGVMDSAPASEQYTSTCKLDMEGYCTVCGYAGES